MKALVLKQASSRLAALVGRIDDQPHVFAGFGKNSLRESALRRLDGH
jgi:hypothetical protein